MLKESEDLTLPQSSGQFRDLPIEERLEKHSVLVAKNDDKVAIIFYPHPKSTLLPKGEFKVLSSRRNPISVCCRRLREFLSLETESTLTYTCDKNKMILQNDIVSELYQKYKDPKDGYLYIQYSEVQAMGST